ncbi:MAG: DoxX family membrane protein [Nitrospinota bacterium]|nr:DoxX family membrane protein [Nitrospinota bacterium]MDH5756552.1 DoxX family membrane protein [Nitrospinota bacterium]
MENTIKLVGRIMIAGLFAWAAIREVMNPAQIMSGVKSSGLPAPGLFFVIILVLLVASSAMVIAGYRARHGALGLLVIFLLATFVLKIDIGGGSLGSLFGGRDYGPLLKNLAIAGGLLYIYAAGAGKIGMNKG